MIETTYIRSLSRGDPRNPLLLARGATKSYDADAFDATVQAAVDEAGRYRSHGTFAGYGMIDPNVGWQELRSLRAGAGPAEAWL